MSRIRVTGKAHNTVTRMLLTPARRSVEVWGREGISASVRSAAADLGSLTLCRDCESMLLRTEKLDEEILGAGRVGAMR